jgi:hypothetical protein
MKMVEWPQFSLRMQIRKSWQIGFSGLILAFVIVGAVLSIHHWDVKTFIMIGSWFEEGNLEGEYGYDGQFAYYIASDPMEASSKIDHPAYRYQRILYPFLCWLLSFGGNESLLPWVMLGINVFALAVAGALLGQLLEQHAGQAWHALAFLLSSGVLIALRADLNEPLAIMLSLIGLVMAYRGRWSWAGVAFALALLAKEIALAFALGVVAWLVLKGNWRSGAKLFVISLAPAVLWGILVTLWLGESPVGWDQAALEKIPFYGLRFVGLSPAKEIILFATALPAVMFGLLGGIDFLKKKFSLELMVLLANVGLIAVLPRYTWYNAAAALRVTIGLSAISLIYVASKRARLVPWVGAFWMISGLILLPFLIIGPYVN